MVTDEILSAIDATINDTRRHPYTMEQAASRYEKLGREVCRLRGNSIAYRRSERRKIADARDVLMSRERPTS